ncbi:PAS domain S-box protein [Iodidimonas sp. SYSU 1G8]|uniref:PAS domain S-box protein n=1 Tax=Iodidimonas sp. SYSU 1G8 TaxID=3133967 RepID=UPI0031FEA849
MKAGSQRLANAMPDLAWTADRDGVVDFLNDQVSRYTGVALSVPAALSHVVHPSDRQAMVDGWRQALKTSSSFETEARIRRSDDVYRWFRTRILPVTDADGRIDHWFGSAIDINESREAQERLIRENDRILNSISDGFYAVDDQWRFTYVNSSTERMLERSSADMIGRTIWEAFPETAGTTLEERYRYSRTSGESVRFPFHYPPMARWFEIRTFPHSTGLSVYFNDITARVEQDDQLAQKQQALELAVARLQRFLNNTMDVICAIDTKGVMVEINARSLAAWGYRQDELVGRTFRDLVHPDDLVATRAETALIVSGRPSMGFRNRILRKDGSAVHVEWSSTWSEEDQLFFNVARDVTNQVDAEIRLRQAQRLEALGQLTGGVAHDFNNLLTVILGNAEFLAEELDTAADLRGLALSIQHAAERGAALNNRLLAFARRQALEPKVTEVNTLIGGMDPLLRRTLGEHIEIETVRGGGLWRALVDPAQLEAALLNLCLNARDAMPQGGRLTIETANTHLDRAYAALHDEVVAGQYVMIAVADTGAGMTPEVMARAFEPFFTTKDVGKGSGLGLSMVYGFAKQSGGHIKIYSELGQGTVAKLYLPRTLQPQPEVRAPTGALARGGTECILLVEDDDLVRDHVSDQLKTFGYRVVAVANGPDALEALQEMADFDLLFTDVVMPRGLNGRQLAAQARMLRPNLPVLFTSGYTENAIIHHGRLDPGVHLLAKPYRREELGHKVREVLDEAAAMDKS